MSLIESFLNTNKGSVLKKNNTLDDSRHQVLDVTEPLGYNFFSEENVARLKRSIGRVTNMHEFQETMKSTYLKYKDLKNSDNFIVFTSMNNEVINQMTKKQTDARNFAIYAENEEAQVIIAPHATLGYHLD